MGEVTDRERRALQKVGLSTNTWLAICGLALGIVTAVAGLGVFVFQTNFAAAQEHGEIRLDVVKALEAHSKIKHPNAASLSKQEELTKDIHELDKQVSTNAEAIKYLLRKTR